MPVDKRIAYLRACRPDVAALNMGSMNYAKYSPRRKDFVFQAVFANPFDEIVELLEAMNELGIKPEHECFDVGHVGSLAPLLDMGVLRPPLHVSLRHGRHRRHPADRAQPRAHGRQRAGGLALGCHRHRARASGCSSRPRSRSAARSASALEDNFYLPDGTMARSNGELVAKARALTEDVGRRPATVAEARALLGVPRTVAA